MKITISSPTVFVFPLRVSAYLADPPTFAESSTASDCSGWIVASFSDTCPAIASAWSSSATDFSTVYNPSIGPTCKLTSGQSYCVERNWGIPPEKPTSSTTTTPTPTAGNGITTPLPTQSGIVDNCNKFVLVAGVGCWDVAIKAGISLDDFYAWNKGVGADCETLWVNTYYCIGTIGGALPASTSTTTLPPTTTGNGISTPVPTQSGIATNCYKFYKTKPGQGCADVTSENGIAFSDFYTWNQGVGETCASMWANTWYCVGLVGGQIATKTTSPSAPTTTGGNGIRTPTPTQPGGMTPNCDRFHLVGAGESCSTVLSKNGLTMAQLYALNPGVLDDCREMWAGVHLCVHSFR